MQDLLKLQADEIQKIADDSIKYFEEAIRKQGLILESELVDSFRSAMANRADVIAAEISFMYYGRYKDMKQLDWTATMPPVDVMEKYINKVGLGRFAWIPGYEDSNAVPVRTVAVKRLAWAISNSFKNRSVKRKQGSWYNKTKQRMVNVARRRIMDVTRDYLTGMVVEGFEKL